MFKETEAQKLENAKKLKDFMFKKSPSLLKGWQKRYFIIADDGHQLAWFKNDQIGAKPKGSIPIKEIKEISTEGNKILTLTYSDRKFTLKTESSEQLEVWKNALSILRTFWNDEKNKDDDESDSMGQSASGVAGKGKGWKSKNMEQETLRAIVSEKEKILADQTNLTKNIDNRSVMQEKGIYQYLQAIKPEEMMKRRLIAGFLNKRSKGKMKYFQRRWFILISAKPLFDNDQDEEILEENKLPPWMELDTLYYFRFKDEKDKTNKKGEIKMKECLDVNEKDMSNSKEKGWAFKINMGDRLFHILTDIEAERARWGQALRNSMKTAHEMSKKKGIKKNIDNIVSIYDSGKSLDEKVKNLRAKMDSDIGKLKERVLVGGKVENYDSLISLLDPMKTELIDILNACLAKEPKRTDIIKEYIDYYHEKVCDELTKFWDIYHDEMGNLTYLSISKWINAYAESLKLFVVDERIMDGIKQLLKTYFEKTSATTEVIIDGIIDFSRKNPPQKDDQNLLFSTAPYDLFKIINEIFDLSYKLCPLKETALKLASFAKKVITSFHSKLQELLDEEAVALDVNKFVCVSNNTITICNLIKTFNQRLLDECQLKPEEADKYFDNASLSKMITGIGKQASDVVSTMLFGHYNQFFNKTLFLSVNLEKILGEVDKQKAVIDLLHESYARKVWKSFLEKLVILYFQTFIMSCSKMSKDDGEKVSSKLENDEQFLFNEFDGILFTNTVKTILKPFSDMMPFLDDTSLFSIQQACKNLRTVFGPAFNEKTVKAIFNLRFDLESYQKNDIVEACKDTLNIYNKENFEKEKNDAEHGRIYELFEEGINLEDEEGEKAGGVNNDDDKNRRKSIKLDDLDAPQSEVKEEEVKVEKVKEKVEEKFSGEGFLYKKPPRKYKLKWELRYFRIKNGVLYWYLNERSRESQNKIKLADVEDIFPHPNPEKNKKFKIKITEKGKVYKFMAETAKDRQLWIKALREEILRARNQMIEKEDITQLQISKGKEKQPLFKDYLALKNSEKFSKLNEDKMTQEKNVKNKIQNLKAKLLVQKMQTNMNAMNKEKASKGAMSNPKMLNKTKTLVQSMDLETTASESVALQRNETCWRKFLDCLGLAEMPENERFIKQ